MINLIKKILENPSLPLYLGLLSAVLALPSLWVGFQFDDFFHRTIILDSQETTWSNSPKEIFTLSKSDPERVLKLIDAGIVPWWTNPYINLAFWRPLSAAVQGIEYRLWPFNPVPMHLILILILGVLTFLAAILYRRLFGNSWIAGLAAILYAVDDGHGAAVGWIAGHNTLLVALFGIATLIFHDVWRKDGKKVCFVAAIIFWILTLFSNEGAVAILAFIFSYSVFLDSAKGIKAIASFFPYLAVFVIWFSFYAVSGFGAQGSGFYFDPIRETWEFLSHAFIHGPVLLLSQWGVPSAQLFPFYSESMVNAVFLVALAFIAVLAKLLFPLIRSSELARFWVGGMVLSLIPVSSTIPSSRLLFFVGLGAYGLMAQFFNRCFESNYSTKKSGVTILLRGFAVSLILINFPFKILSFPISSCGMILFENASKGQFAEIINARLNMTDKVVIVNGSCAFFTAFVGGFASSMGKPSPKCFHLGPGIYPMEIERTDERTILVRPEGGFLQKPGTWKGGTAPIHLNYLIQHFDRIYRTESRRFSVGDKVFLNWLTICVKRTNDLGLPTEVEFSFKNSLEHPSLNWFAWRGEKLQVFSPPPIGTIQKLPSANSYFQNK